MSLYEDLKSRYGLTEQYPSISFQEEKKLIKQYQTTSSESIKNHIVEIFWNINKARIVQIAIKLYNYLTKLYHGNINVEITELIQKGYLAIPHCLKIYHKVGKKKPNETKDQYEQRKSKILQTRFGTLLQWWIRPFVMQHINQENFMIYVPHSKTSETKSVSISSTDDIAFDNSPKTQADYIASDDPTPEELVRKELFWDVIKENLTPEEFTFLKNWVYMDQNFKFKKDFYKFYKLNSTQVKTKLKTIQAKLKEVLIDFKDAY